MLSIPVFLQIKVYLVFWYLHKIVINQFILYINFKVLIYSICLQTKVFLVLWYLHTNVIQQVVRILSTNYLSKLISRLAVFKAAEKARA